MALDNAQFIAELSITDPPGTDPLSQGDDQIRTIKRATQQSFPLIAAAVTLTDVQMNLAAIKNEANIFTAAQTITSGGLFMNRAAATGAIEYTLQNEFSGREWRSWMEGSGGTNFQFNFDRYSSGVLQGNVFSVDPTTRVVNFDQAPTVAGAPLWIAGEIRQFAIAATPGPNWFAADGTNGTANLADRWLVGAGAFAGAVGTNLNAALDALTTANTTGATAISAAQMPVHNHNLRGGSASGLTDVQVGFASSETVTGANRSNLAGSYFNTNSSGQRYIDNAGSGSGHTHSSPAQDVVAQNPTFTGSVQPVSFAVATFQYVP